MENEKDTTHTPIGGVKNKVIETYAEDMAKVIKGTEGGLIKKIIHEQEIHELEKKNFSPKSRKNQIFMLVGFLLLAFALGLLVFLGFYQKKANTIEIQVPSNAIIFTDQNYFQDISRLSKDAIIQSVFNQVKNTDVEKGGIEAIFLTDQKQVVGLREFIKLINGNFIVPSTELVSDNFLMGVVNKSDKEFFILLKTRSFLDIFESIKNWENKMFYDLYGFFGIKISPDTKELLSKNFIDGRIANKNARVLYDQNGKIVLMYIFVDNNSVVITDSEEATAEIILRLASSQISK